MSSSLPEEYVERDLSTVQIGALIQTEIQSNKFSSSFLVHHFLCERLIPVGLNLTSKRCDLDSEDVIAFISGPPVLTRGGFVLGLTEGFNLFITDVVDEAAVSVRFSVYSKKHKDQNLKFTKIFKM